jgi:small acid-soluble spore protein I (minor)
MNVNIREYIRNNFKKSDASEIEESIESSISSNDEVILPGLGVLFEIVWQNCSEDVKNNILQTLVNNI